MTGVDNVGVPIIPSGAASTAQSVVRSAIPSDAAKTAERNIGLTHKATNKNTFAPLPRLSEQLEMEDHKFLSSINYSAIRNMLNRNKDEIEKLKLLVLKIQIQMKKKQTEDISFILNSYKLTKDSLLKWLNDLSSKQGNTVFCDPEENSVSTLKTEIKNLNKGPQDFNSGKYKNKANSLSNKVYKLCFMYESMDKMLPHSDNFLVSVETDKTLNSLCAFNSVLLAACKNSQDSSSSQPKASPPILDVSPKKK